MEISPMPDQTAFIILAVLSPILIMGTGLFFGYLFGRGCRGITHATPKTLPENDIFETVCQKEVIYCDKPMHTGVIINRETRELIFLIAPGQFPQQFMTIRGHLVGIQ